MPNLTLKLYYIQVASCSGSGGSKRRLVPERSSYRATSLRARNCFINKSYVIHLRVCSLLVPRSSRSSISLLQHPSSRISPRALLAPLTSLPPFLLQLFYG